MRSPAINDVSHMRDAVMFDGPDVRDRLSRFWILLTLSSIIASAGVVADSTATVIGAMIVAPLMIPIQGTMLSVVLGDRANLLKSIALVITGALAAIAIAWLMGMLAPIDVVAATSSQVAARVNPRLIDLIAALATGVVGSVALIRRDISDTLPGVAIAISLVPPLAVVGLTLAAGAYTQSVGALLLFVTNVAAILFTGTIVMALYDVYRVVPAAATAEKRPVNRRNAVLVIAAMLVIVGAPLTASSVRIVRETTRESKVREVSSAWASASDWEVVEVTTRQGKVIVRLEGAPPLPDTSSLRDRLIRRGLDPGDVRVELLPRATIDLGDPSPTSTQVLP